MSIIADIKVTWQDGTGQKQVHKCTLEDFQTFDDLRAIIQQHVAAEDYKSAKVSFVPDEYWLSCHPSKI